jgi:hypothetical protein
MEVFNSGEFNHLADSVITLANGTPKKPYYGWGYNPVITLPITVGQGHNPKTGDSLQTIINAANYGDTVFLAQKAVVRVTHTLRMKSGVTLATYGLPTHYQYAKMARLIRTGDDFNPNSGNATLLQPVVIFGGDENWGGASDGSKLRSIWVDGQRSALLAQYGQRVLIDDNERQNKINIRICTNGTCEISNCRINDPLGPNNVQVVFSQGGTKWIDSNLITGYGNSHFFRKYTGYDQYVNPRADGIDVADQNGYVYNNHIVDITDVGICLFPAYPYINDDSTATSNNSIVVNNQIFNAGNSAFTGINIDPLNWKHPHYDSTKIKYNLLYTSPSAHMDIGLGVGTRYCFGTCTGGTGSEFSENTSGSDAITCNAGIVLDGMTNVTISNNTISTRLQELINMPEAVLMENSNTVYASGALQTGFVLYPDSVLYNADHAPVYISGPTEVYAPTTKGSSSTFTWTAVRIDDVPPVSYTWTFIENGDTIRRQTGGTSFSVSRSGYGRTGSVNCLVQCNVGAVEAGPNLAKKYVTEYFGISLAKKGLGGSESNPSDNAVPTTFALFNNYPNPFNPTTIISFTLERDGYTTLKVYDLLGREVTTLVNGMMKAGVMNTVNFNASKLSSGVYFSRLKSGGNVQIKKLLLMK